MWKMTEVGLTCESYEEVDGEKILDVEVTPNRPDWISITGITREIATAQNSKFTLPKIPEIPRPTANLPIKVNFKTSLTGGYAGITVHGVQVKDSPEWMADRLIAVGLRPINNLVDITNYAMFELGIPIHVFDYDKFLTKDLTMTLSKGGEEFESVDELKYKLPADTLIIKDKDRVIDLCGIKGGANTGISKDTKNIFIHVPVYDGAYIRKTSQLLKLKSDASYIYERGPNALGVGLTLKRVVSLVLELAGGQVALKPIVNIDKKLKPSVIDINPKEVKNILGQDITKTKIIEILEHLEFGVKQSGDILKCTSPYFRSDVKIKEDVFEEIARIYGYNNFDRALPESGTTPSKIPYLYNREFELKLKDIFCMGGFFEMSSGALTSETNIKNAQLNPDIHIRIANPVSQEYEYLRTSLVPGLIAAEKLNTDEVVNLFEYGKIYQGPVDNAREPYKISAITKAGFEKIKGLADFILQRLNIDSIEIKPFALTSGLWHPTRAGVFEKDGEEIGVCGEINTKVLRNYQIKEPLFALEFDAAALMKFETKYTFKSIPKYPAQIEDLTLNLEEGMEVGKIIAGAKSVKFVEDVKFVEAYKNSVTLRIYYSNPGKTLDDSEVGEIRKALTKKLKEKFKIKPRS